MNKELKPCPFCGGEPYTAVTVAVMTNNIVFKIACYECSVERSVSIGNYTNLEKAQSAIDKVVDLWNGRA